MSETDLEQKLLEILDDDEIDNSEGFVDALEEAGVYFEKEEKDRFRDLLEKRMKSPEEIKQSMEIADHNAEIDRKRAIKMAQRKMRRELGLKRPKKRKKNG